MSGLRIRIGGDGPAVAESDASDWRLIVRGSLWARGFRNEDLHVSLRDPGLGDRNLARDALGVVCSCAGSWEDE